MSGQQTGRVSGRRTGTGSLGRKVAVTVAYLLCLLGTMVGVGVFGGTPIADAAGGLLSADATHLAPGSGAFSIWSVIYAGLAAYTLWQWWDHTDARRLAWPAAMSMVLNAAWILVVQAGQVWGSVLVIVALLAVLALILVRLVAVRARSRVETVVADGTFGLYLGWVCVATCANIAAALAGSGVDGGASPQWWATAVLAVAAAVGVALALYGHGRLAVAAALGWGLAWIAVGRSDGGLTSATTAVAAAAAAVVVVLATVATRLRAPHPRGTLRRGGDPA
ncbi:tryptophan-rich sensory protein [Georgenia yuyongxinii]|uniref:tryptophan-rich sensory protein n=2 Tax=Georgenia yuyongxinii TaxID=2589797 RepID=UPI001E5ECF3D|nr:tryptophan-rich sensory protein [Georgenia yuyongxinii]